MSDSVVGRYEIAHLALMGVMIVPTIVLWGCSLCMVRSRKDPARRWTGFFKTAFILFAM
jgi:hypothetical protein